MSHSPIHTHIHTLMAEDAMQGADLFISSGLGFSILPIHTDIQPEQGTTNLLIIGQPTRSQSEAGAAQDAKGIGCRLRL